jgi:hypothetical protein
MKRRIQKPLIETLSTLLPALLADEVARHFDGQLTDKVLAGFRDGARDWLVEHPEVHVRLRDAVEVAERHDDVPDLERFIDEVFLEFREERAPELRRWPRPLYPTPAKE